ncbi:MAG TPA: L,D-transpeptidase, partial [Longimicrobiales bacterium]
MSRLLVASCLLGAFGTGCARRTAPAPECLEATQLAAPDTALIAQQAPRELLDEIAADSTIHLVLNVPAFTVSVLSGDSVVRAYPVAVGSPRYPTRLGSFSIQTITWNPWWIPPESEWARNEQTTPPGPSNPMGKVKLNYTSAYYLHGTPDSTRLRRPVSHGCVRMQNRDVIELALIVQDASGVRLSAEEQEQLLTSWQHNRTLTLGAGVRLDVRYQLAVA